MKRALNSQRRQAVSYRLPVDVVEIIQTIQKETGLSQTEFVSMAIRAHAKSPKFKALARALKELRGV